jgi:hypothetical protein
VHLVCSECEAARRRMVGVEQKRSDRVVLGLPRTVLLVLLVASDWPGQVRACGGLTRGALSARCRLDRGQGESPARRSAIPSASLKEQTQPVPDGSPDGSVEWRRERYRSRRGALAQPHTRIYICPHLPEPGSQKARESRCPELPRN